MTFEEYEELNFRKIREKIDKSDTSNVDLTKDEIFDIFKDYYYITHTDRTNMDKITKKGLSFKSVEKRLYIILVFIQFERKIKIYTDYRMLKKEYEKEFL